MTGHRTRITSIAYEEQNNFIATSSADATVKIWDTRSSNTKPIFNFTGHNDVVRDVAISPDGRWIASAGAEGNVLIWELDTGKIVQDLPQHMPNSRH
jgi:katanin p80 WD40 repeat-containing subunit B1